MSPNIFAVAKRAGVSVSTVSRVLRKPDVVAAQTRLAVLKAVEQLGYTTNAAAQNLRMQRSGKLLVTVPDISNPFYGLMLQGLEDAAQREGYSVLLGDTQHDSRREEGYVQMLRRREADGMIVLGHGLPKAAALIVQQMGPLKAPIVNGCEFSPKLGIPSARINNGAAAAEAMDYLYSLGHRRIGIVTGPSISPLSRERLRGARSRATAANLGHDLLVYSGDFSIESGKDAATPMLSGARPPTAVFCFNDQMAIGFIDMARRRGFQVPHDISVVGFDDIQFARYVDPPLTTVAQPVREIGEGTVRLMLALLNSPKQVPASITLPHTLVVRKSTGPPRS